MKFWTQKIRNSLIALLGYLFISTGSAFASAFNCSVDIYNVLMYRNGAVNVRHSGRSDYTYICNLNLDWKGVSVTTCAMWASLLTSQQQRNLKVTFYYNDPDFSSCSMLPTYSDAPSPVYVGTVQQY